MTSRLAIMMGGRVAEEMIFGQREGHLRRRLRHRAGDQARAHDGDALGLLRRARHRRLWREPGRGVPRPFGGAPAERLRGDQPEDRRRDQAPGRGRLCRGASSILDEKRADLETLAKGLLEYETLTGDEIKDLLAGKRPVREAVIEPAAPRSSAVPTAGKGRAAPRARPDGAAAAGVSGTAPPAETERPLRGRFASDDRVCCLSAVTPAFDICGL